MDLMEAALKGTIDGVSPGATAHVAVDSRRGWVGRRGDSLRCGYRSLSGSEAEFLQH